MISLVQFEANITCYQTPRTDTFQAHRWFCPTGSWRREAGSSCSQACSLHSKLLKKINTEIITPLQLENKAACAILLLHYRYFPTFCKLRHIVHHFM